MEQASASFCRAVALICSGVQNTRDAEDNRMIAAAYGESAPADYSGQAEELLLIAAMDFRAAYALIGDGLPTV